MSDEVDTLGILEDIEALICDKLQVVSYKWLSRNYLVSSNAAKRLLADFVAKHGKSFEVVYSLSGWLKNDPSFYHTRLVSGTKLAVAKQEFDEDCSVHVYSVQTCLPQDPATLWNVEFVQSGELFEQLSTVDNCLRDNRFSGISYSFDKPNTDGTLVSPQQAKISGVPESSKSNVAHPNVTLPQPQQRSLQHSSPKLGLQSSSAVADVKKNVSATETVDRATKAPLGNERAHPLTTNKKKVQNDKESTGKGSSLANMWDRASSKSKTSSATTDFHNLNPNSSEAQISTHESLEDGNSEDDGGHVNFKRASNGEGNRKRKVVFDFSDEEHEFEDAVNLESPGVPKGKSLLDTKIIAKMSIAEKSNLNFDNENEGKQTIREEIASDHDSKSTSKQDTAAINGNRTTVSSPDNIQSNIPNMYTNKKDGEVDVPPTSPKRKKVLKTQIDKRGREVTEVIWEGADTVLKKDDMSVLKKSDNNTAAAAATDPPSRAPARTTKKSPALGGGASNPSGKAGNKRGDKDAKQKNIYSFFKKA